HRLLLAELSQEPAAGQDQDRQELRARPEHGLGHRGRCRHRARHRAAGAQPLPAGDRRGRGDLRAGTLPDRPGLRRGPGLPVQQAVAGPRADSAAAQPWQAGGAHNLRMGGDLNKSFARMQIFRIIARFPGTTPNSSKDFAMPRLPLASASLLAIAIALAGCGDDKNATPANQTSAPASQQSAPAAAAFDQAEARAVDTHYGDLAAALFGEALSTAQAQQAAIDRFRTPPGQATRDP